MKVLILYATVEGQTAKIAEMLSREFEQIGHEVFLTNVTDPGYCDPAIFDAAVMCGPIHMGNYPSALISYLQNWKHALAGVPNALVTVSLAISSKDPEMLKEAEAYPDTLIEQTGWQPDELHNAAGALKYVEYDFFKRWVMRRIAINDGRPTDTSKDHEMTDWNALSAFAKAFSERSVRAMSD